MILLDALKTHFGFNEFRPHQETIIDGILSKRDVMAILPTGSGKSLCYQLPAVLMPGTAVVISPLIALMQDQMLQLTRQGIAAECISSANNAGKSNEILSQASRFKLLYIAPERLSVPGFLEALSQINLSFFVIDEAHCISQWGHSFRPDYRMLSLLKTQFPNVPIAAFTATATPDVQRDMKEQLFLQDPVLVKSSFDRPNLRLKIEEKNNYLSQLQACLDRHAGESGIIYCSTRKKVDTVYQQLRTKHSRVAKYHAGLSDIERQKALSDFIYEKVDIMVATVAFGMGINKPNVRFVFHVDMPQNIENYYQEIGRAGRDGLPAECVMLVSIQDIILHKRFLDEILDDKVRMHQRRKIDLLLALSNSASCRRQELLRYFGEDYPGNCNQCDNCLDDVSQIDGTIIAQKILSCVYRLNQNFGIQYVTDILHGSTSQLIQQRGHQRLSTYGLLSECPKTDIRHFIVSLINQGYLTISQGDYPVLKLVEKSKAVLFDKQPVYFRQTIVKAKSKTKTSRQGTSPSTKPTDTALFLRLKELRRRLADEAKVPPYIIFHDKTLLEIAHIKPQTEAEFLNINGVGEQKLKRYGKVFVEEVISDSNSN
jgi:ATP-dependent DNA helicase RecQ